MDATALLPAQDPPQHRVGGQMRSLPQEQQGEGCEYLFGLVTIETC